MNKSDNVIPLHRYAATSESETIEESNIDSLLRDALTNPEVGAHFKQIMEAAVLDAWMKAKLFDIEKIDNPFDAIYISELRADHVALDDIDRIQRYFNIIDISNTISFQDEWED